MFILVARDHELFGQHPKLSVIFVNTVFVCFGYLQQCTCPALFLITAPCGDY
jgi:hypothetical protein